MIVLALVLGVLGVVVIHTTQPRFRKRLVSAAKFFQVLPPPNKSSAKLSFNNPFKIPAFYPRLLVALLILVGALALQQNWGFGEKQGVKAWFLLDSSSSMLTLQNGKTRWDLGLQTLDATMETIQKQASEKQAEFRLSLFDLAIRDFGQGRLNQTVSALLGPEMPRQLGTDLGLLRRAIKQGLAAETQHPFTHLVVISDRPAPAWLVNLQDTNIVWQDISQKVVNVGFETVSAVRNPLTGNISQVVVAVSSHGREKPNLPVQVIFPNQSTQQQAVIWRNNQQGQIVLPVSQSGMYEMKLPGRDSYAEDDDIRFLIPPARGLRVDWRLENRHLPQQLGWVITRENPQLVVAPATGLPEDGFGSQTLLVGNGIELTRSEIRDFVEDSKLIQDLNFDVLERFQPMDRGPQEVFRAHLRTENGFLWAAQSEDAQMVYVAGVPVGEDTEGDRLLATLFFNSLRAILDATEMPPLHTLTTPFQPQSAGTRLNLHPEEGNTGLDPISFGNLDGVAQEFGGKNQNPLWPSLFMAAVIVLITERFVSLWGVRLWR